MAREQPPLEEMTLRQLRKVASDYNISRYSRMRKEQLLAEILKRIRTEGLNSPSLEDTTPEAPATAVAAVTPPAVAQVMTPALPTSTPPVEDIAMEEQKFALGEPTARMEAQKFDLGDPAPQVEVSLADVDANLPDLPGGYGESRIVLLPRDPQWAYAYWDISNEHKEELRRQGGQQLALRICDVTGINLDYQFPHSIQEYPCDELARDWYLPVPVSDRDYIAEIGYRCVDGRWLILARSASVRIPPVYPSDWIEDHFMTVGWDDELRGRTLMELVPPSHRIGAVANGQQHRQMFERAAQSEAMRATGSVFGSMQQIPEQAISSYIFPSGIGAIPTASGIGMSGIGMGGVGMAVQMSGIGMSGIGMAAQMSGIGMSGIGMGRELRSEMYSMAMWMSGSGLGMFSASAAPARPRKFWLVADAELIVYGATEPDATVTVGGQPVKLNADGTFRFQMSFPDGIIDYPIMAVAADGEQTRSIHMNFKRETPSRRTNTKEEAVLEWLPN